MNTNVTIEASKAERCSTLRVEREGVKKYLHSKYRPLQEAEQWAEQVAEKESKDYVVFGGGLLYHIRSLLDKIDSNSTVLVVEPDKSVYEMAKDERKVEELLEDGRFSLFNMEKQEDFKKYLFSILERRKLHRIKVSVFPQYELVYPEEYAYFIKTMNDYTLFERIDLNTSKAFSIEHTANIFSNLYFAAKSTFVMSLRDQFQGKTAVVVSAGPSLDKNIDQLKGNEDRFLIIAGGRTLKTLLDRGIKPHLAVALDPSYDNFRLIRDVVDSEVPMVVSLLSNRSIVSNYKGEKIFLNNSGIDKLDQYFFDRHIDTLAVGSTVAIMQMNLAIYMGCSKIVLIGQDLAYTDGKFHSDSTLWLEEERDGGNEFDISESGFVKVKGNMQDYVYTDAILYNFINTFNKHVYNNIEKAQVYNCTEGGAYIQNTVVMTLADFMSEFAGEKDDFYEKIEEIIKENKTDYPVAEIKKRIHLLEKDANTIIRFCKEAIQIVSKNIAENQESEKDSKKLKKIENKIWNLTRRFDIAATLSRDALKTIGDAELDANKSLEEQKQDLRKLNRVFYATIQGIYMGFDYIMKEMVKEVFDEEEKPGEEEDAQS